MMEEEQKTVLLTVNLVQLGIKMMGEETFVFWYQKPVTQDTEVMEEMIRIVLLWLILVLQDTKMMVMVCVLMKTMIVILDTKMMVQELCVFCRVLTVLQVTKMMVKETTALLKLNLVSLGSETMEEAMFVLL